MWTTDRNAGSLTFHGNNVKENEKTALEKFEIEHILISVMETIAVFTYLKTLQTLKS